MATVQPFENGDGFVSLFHALCTCTRSGDTMSPGGLSGPAVEAVADSGRALGRLSASGMRGLAEPKG